MEIVQAVKKFSSISRAIELSEAADFVYNFV